MVDLGFDVRDDHVDSLNGHLVQLEVVRREPVVGNNDVRILLSRLNVLLKGWLRLVLVRFEKLSQGDLLILVPDSVLKDAS